MKIKYRLIKTIQCWLPLAAVFFFDYCYAAQNHPLYVGIASGYGTSTWGQLVPSKANANAAMETSTPISVREGGTVWGILAGYELLPVFGVELAYYHYPNATLYHSVESIFAMDHDGLTSFTSRTETVSLVGKFMFFLPSTTVRAYSDVGIAGLHRYDMLINRWRWTPTFGVGFNYMMFQHWMAELSFMYTAGYGESQITPMEGFMPFLLAGVLSFSYHF